MDGWRREEVLIEWREGGRQRRGGRENDRLEKGKDRGIDD